MLRRGLAHQGPLAPVAVAARAEHDDQPPHHVRTQRLERGFQRVGRMGVIHENRRAIRAATGQLHPPAHAGQTGQDGKHRLRVLARRDHEPRRRQHVHRLKGPDQRQARLHRLALPAEQDILPGLVQPAPGDLQPRILGVLRDPDHLDPARGTGIAHTGPVTVVEVDHRHAILGQQLGEEPQLGGEIALHVAVVIEVILREVGEGRRRKVDTIHPPLVQPVRRSLHRGMADVGRHEVMQQPVQRHRIGRRVDARRGKAPLDAGGADIDRPEIQRLPDLAGETGHARLAVGAGDRDHAFGLRAPPQGRGMGQCGPRILDHDQRGLGPGHVGPGHLGPGPVGQDRARALFQRRGDERRPMHPRAGQRREKRALLHLPAVERHARHRDVTAVSCRQAKVGQCPCLLRHAHPPAHRPGDALISRRWIAHRGRRVQSPVANPSAARCGG